MNESKVRHVVSVSGGKDSDATLKIALNRCPRGTVIPIFCDTDNEDRQASMLAHRPTACASRI